MKVIGLLSVTALGALALAQSAGSVFTDAIKALQSAQTLQAKYTIQPVNGTPSEYTVTLARPNKFRVESATSVLVSDGSTVTRLDKSEGKFYSRPATATDPATALSGASYLFYSAFFNANAVQPSAVRDLGTREQGGGTYRAVAASVGKQDVTLFLDPTDKVTRKAQIQGNSDADRSLSVMNASNVTVNGPVDASVFTFRAPANAKEVSEAEFYAAHWITDLEEAKRIAARTNKDIFVDFMATWCGPCKLLDKEVFATDRFKKLSSKLVFLKIDVDAQASIASAYKIEAMPTQMVLDKNGAVIDSTVGYADPATFFSWLDGAMRK